MRTVLVVAKDRCLRTALMRRLNGNYVVRGSSSARTARRSVQREQVDVVVLDMAASDEEALTLLSFVCSRRLRPRVVVLSLVDEVGKAIRVMKLGASDLLAKPCDPEAVMQTVQDLIAGG